MFRHLLNDSGFITLCFIHSVKKACFKTLVDEVQELEALSKDPGAVVHGKRYSYTTLPLLHSRLCSTIQSERRSNLCLIKSR